MEEEQEGASKGRLLMGMGLVLVIIGVIVFIIIGQKPQQATEITKFIPYTAPDKAFACVLPDGWKRVESAGGGIQSGVKAEAGRARINVNADLAGSLMADISKAQDAQMSNIAGMIPGNAQGNVPARKSPVEKAHIAFKNKMESVWEDYEEKGSKPMQSAFGEAWISEWTGKKKELLGSEPRHGLRVTMLSGERQVTVVCYCAEDDWKTLVPAFSKVIKSLAPGGA